MTTSPDLLHSPFILLGASPRDNRRRIVELADERALHLPDAVCQKARSDLTNPRSRLAAEIGWLPGLSPSRADQLCRVAVAQPLSMRTEQNVPHLARANLLAAALQALSGRESKDEIASLVEELADTVERLDPAAIQRDINEDRLVSGFPPVGAVDAIESLVEEQRRFYRSSIKSALDELPASTLVSVITELVDDVTLSGDAHAPQLIDELVDAYDLEVRRFLDIESSNVDQLLDLAREIASRGEEALDPVLEELERVIQNWDKVAQPIQVSAKARGIAHQPSRIIAMKVRSLAVDLWNEHELLNVARRITAMLGEVFAELPEMEEKLQGDAEALERIAEAHKSAKEAERAREDALTFSARIGLIGQPLKITPEGISWKGQFHPLALITKVRWGGVNRSINGIPTGSNFTIGFGNENYESVIETGDSRIYSAFLERLWPAVCIRILVDILRSAGGGQNQIVGNTGFSDSTILLKKQKIFAKPILVELPWTAVKTLSHNGTFWIFSKTDRDVSAGFPYVTTWNAHILEHIVDLAISKQVSRLSELLGN